jgi:hypothetical protein
MTQHFDKIIAELLELTGVQPNAEELRRFIEALPSLGFELRPDGSIWKQATAMDVADAFDQWLFALEGDAEDEGNGDDI